MENTKKKINSATNAPTSNLAGWTTKLWKDELTGEHSLQIGFPLVSGGKRVTEVSLSLVDSPPRIREKLRGLGARTPQDKTKATLMIASLVQKMPTQAKTKVAMPGWHGKSFVMPNRVIGEKKGSIALAQMPKDRCLISGISGSLAHWKEGVAKAAMASTYLSFTIMVAFAAPLMRFSKLSEGAIFNLSCSSTSGKTTATQCAQSVFGTPDAFADWNSTSISLEELAAAYNDLLFVLDDTEKAKKADITELLDKAAHILPDGRPRNYSRFYAGHNKARALRWRCIGLSSSPKSIDDLYAERGTERSLGQRVRLIDLPIPANPHLGLFDHVTGDGAQLEKKLRKTIRAMDSALDKNFGKAVPPWIEFIRSSKAETRVPDLITKFVRHAAQSSGAAESRVAAKFGLVYAAGMMALEAKILPWPEEWVLSTILKCFNLARSKLPKNGNETAVKKAGLASLLTNAKSIPTLDVTKPLSRKEEKESIGFRFSKGGAKVVGLKRDSLKTFCGSEAGVKSLLKSFVSQKICLGNGGVPRAIQVRVHVAVKYPTGRTKNEEIKRRVVLLDARAVDQLLARAEKPLLAKTTAAKTVTKATA